MSLADAWESNASDWIAWARAPGHDGFWEGTWPALTEILPEPAGLVLDLGCGEGRCSRLLQASGRRVVGLDRSPTLAKAAKSGSPPVPVTLADAAALPFADDAFGLVVACMSLMDIDDFDGAVRQAARVLGPDGGVLPGGRASLRFRAWPACPWRPPAAAGSLPAGPAL